MKARLIIILAAAIMFPALGHTAKGCAAKPAVRKGTARLGNADLELAKMFARLGDWEDAEIHFAAAAKDPRSLKEALPGIEAARRHQEDELLQVGQLYESEHQWSKAEDLYRAAAADPSTGTATRKILDGRLRSALQEQSREKRWADWKEKVKDTAEASVFCLALFLLVATLLSILSSRRTTVIQPFAAPTDELAKGLDIHLRYARAMMQDPALSPAGQVPASLVENLLTFADETESIEDLEIAGSKVPFASLAKLFGRPRIQVTGGFDGVAPIGNAYSIVKGHDDGAYVFIQHTIRVGEPSEQRRDLLDFAYDVIVKASSVNVDV